MRQAALMIPGTLCDASVFDGIIARLPGYDAVVADLTTHARVEDAAAAFLDDAPPRFLCVGFSLGGFIALEMLRRAPERLLGLVLVAGNAHPDNPANAERRRANVALAREIGMAAYVRANAAAWGIAGDAAVTERVIAMACALGPDVHARHAEMNIARPDLRHVAHEAKVSLLVVAGGRDPLCTPDRSAAAAAASHAALLTLPDAGHYLPLEAPEQVAAAIACLEVVA